MNFIDYLILLDKLNIYYGITWYAFSTSLYTFEMTTQAKSFFDIYGFLVKQWTGHNSIIEPFFRRLPLFVRYGRSYEECIPKWIRVSLIKECTCKYYIINEITTLLLQSSWVLGCPNRTEPRPNRNKNSEKPKPQTAIFSQNHGLQFFARNSAQKWSKLLNFEKVHNFPLNCYPLSSLLNAQGDWFHWNV